MSQRSQGPSGPGEGWRCRAGNSEHRGVEHAPVLLCIWGVWRGYRIHNRAEVSGPSAAVPPLSAISAPSPPPRCSRWRFTMIGRLYKLPLTREVMGALFTEGSVVVWMVIALHTFFLRKKVCKKRLRSANFKCELIAGFALRLS